MKTFLLLFMSASLLLACDNTEANRQTVVQPTAETHPHGEATSALSLNNGAKWHSDERTTKNVATLQAIVGRFKAKDNKDLAAYTAAGNDLQAALNTLVSECRMKGEDHEALHHWLEPLLAKVKALQQATSKEDAAALFGAVDEQLNLYPSYFE